MNQGLKKYSKTVKYDVGNAGSISVNLNKYYSNTHVIIPLYQSNYKDPINLSLTFSLKTKETDSKNTWEFGIGNRLNLYKNFLADYIPSSIIGGIISMGWGRFFDGRGF